MLEALAQLGKNKRRIAHVPIMFFYRQAINRRLVAGSSMRKNIERVSPVPVSTDQFAFRRDNARAIARLRLGYPRQGADALRTYAAPGTLP